MTTNMWWISIVAALLAGAAVGAWLTMRASRTRFVSRVRRVSNDLQQKHTAANDQLRAAHVRAQTELEQAKNSFKRQLASAAEEPRAAAARAEERLKAAYAELDRLRRMNAAMPDTSPAELSDGFAATRPMHEGM